MNSKSAIEVPESLLNESGLIVVDHGSRREESNNALLELVEQYRSRSPFKIVEPAHMELAEPSIAVAVEKCILRGATNLIVQPFFLFPGRHWVHDIPNLVKEAVARYNDDNIKLKYMVTAPIGIHELVFDILNDRAAYCLNRNANHTDGCDVCNEDFPCRFKGN